MSYTLHGECHCGNLAFELSTQTAPDAIRARACDCSFCRMHVAQTWSDPAGSAVIRVRDLRDLQKYRFALRTADFYICRVCGAFLGAVLEEDCRAWSTVNLRLTGLSAGDEPARYGNEDTGGRLERRKRRWTPTKIVLGA